MRSFVFLSVLLPVLASSQGCRSQQPRVVLYCAQDRDYAEAILAEFTRETGIRVEVRSDTEANKTVGLYEAIVRERQHPRCDVFWNNEVVNTIRLQQQGLLEPYQSPSAQGYPDWTRPADLTWQAFAARARILAVNRRVPLPDRPRTLRDLTEPRWKGRVAMAKPLFGTTATHMACLWAHWGPKPAQEFLTALRENVTILPGNKDVAVAVAEGRFDLGLTDSDDVNIEIQLGKPLDVVFPDQEGMGTLLLPNTLALVKGGPNPQHARKLIDYLLSPGVEAKLAQGPSAQFPLNPSVTVRSPVQPDPSIKPMHVDFIAAASVWAVVQSLLRDLYSR